MSRRVTTWSRLEPRPRNDEMLEGLRGTLRDPLWLLSRQWQLKEFRGEDAGSPVEVDVTIQHDAMTKVRLRGADDPVTVDYEDAPLEALVERERIMTDGLENWSASGVASRDATEPPNRKAAAEAGLHFLRLLEKHEYTDNGTPYQATDFPEHLRLTKPDDPMTSEDRRYLRVMADRTIDGAAVFLAIREAVNDVDALVEGGSWTVDDSDALPLPESASSNSEFEAAIQEYARWYLNLYEEPTATGTAWDATRMEYDFAVATGAAATPETTRRERRAASDGGSGTDRQTQDDSDTDTEEREMETVETAAAETRYRETQDHPEPVETVLEATEYEGGTLDWYSFSPAADDASLGATAFATTETSKTLLPRHVSFPGMPAPRWWEFEDAAVSLDDIAADGVATPRLLLLEFATQFGNDWFQFPVETPVGTLSRVTNLTVTDSFGLTTDDADAAATGSEPPWRLFSHNLPNQETPGLFLPPTLTGSSVQESDPVEEVLLTRDEMANLVFGIEQRVEGATGSAVDRSEFRRPHLAITAVSPDANPNEEYIELENPGDDALDVSGYAVRTGSGDQLVGDLGTLVSDGTIGPGDTVRLYTGFAGFQGFEPPAVRIDQDTDVTFEWVTDDHDLVVADQPDGASWSGTGGIEDQGYTHSHTFTTTGTYRFSCDIHGTVGEKGAIVVGDDPPEYGSWFDGVDNFEGTVDARGQSAIGIDVGAQDPDVSELSAGLASSVWSGVDAAVVADGSDIVATHLLSRPSDALADYRLSTDVPDHWFPFTVEVDPSTEAYRLVRSLLLDADTLGVDLDHIPRPQGEILDPEAGELPDGESNLQIFEEEVTRTGLEVTRRYRLTAWANGSSYLWSGRHASVGRGESSSGLRFDILDEREDGA